MVMGKAYMTKTELARRYGKRVCTINEWMADAALKFPRPITIRGRDLFSIEAQNAWDEAQIKHPDRVGEAV